MAATSEVSCGPDQQAVQKFNIDLLGGIPFWHITVRRVCSYLVLRRSLIMICIERNSKKVRTVFKNCSNKSRPDGEVHIANVI